MAQFDPKNRIADFYKDDVKLPEASVDEYFADEIGLAKEMIRNFKDALDGKRPIMQQDILGVLHLASEYINLMRGNGGE